MHEELEQNYRILDQKNEDLVKMNNDLNKKYQELDQNNGELNKNYEELRENYEKLKINHEEFKKAHELSIETSKIENPHLLEKLSPKNSSEEEKIHEVFFLHENKRKYKYFRKEIMFLRSKIS